MSNDNKNGSRGKRVARKFWMMMKWGMEHKDIMKFYQTLDPIKAQLGLTNMALGKLDQHDPAWKHLPRYHQTWHNRLSH